MLLVLRPADITDAGFQMSFFAVLLIGALSQPIIEMTSAPFRHALVAIDNPDLDNRFSGGPSPHIRSKPTWPQLPLSSKNQKPRIASMKRFASGPA